MALRTLIVTHQKTTWDSRIQRVIGTLGSAGNDVILLSPDTHVALKGLHSHCAIPEVSITRARFLRNLVTRATATALSKASLSLHRRSVSYATMCKQIIALEPDVIHANDWPTLSAAVDTAQILGAKVIYDSHEVAAQEHAEHLWWRLTTQSYVATIEAAMIGKVDHVITVSNGIARFLAKRYPEIIQRLSVVRNLPASIPELPDPHRGDGKIKLVYVGLLRPERCIETMIRAIAALEPRYTLELRGFGPPSFRIRMEKLILKLGVTERIFWADPVPPDDVVRHLSSNDIGLYLSEGLHAQKQHAMPNKIFEYLCGGLAVISAGSLEVRNLLAENQNGLYLKDVSADNLVQAIRSLDAAKLKEMKAQSRQASGRLNWGIEERKLLDIYAKLSTR